MKKGGSFLDHSYILLVFVFCLSAFLTCATAPLIRLLLERSLGDSFALQRVMSRAFAGYVLVLFVLYRKRLKSKVGESLNHTRLPWIKHLLCGFGIGIGSLVILAGVMLIMGAAEIKVQFSLADSGRKLLKYLGVAAVVAMAEEVFFRGIVLQNLRADLKAFLALLLTSVFFSLVHFLNPADAPELSRFDLFDGFRLFPYFFRPFADLQAVWPIAAGLFLIGAALAVAYLVTGSLFLPIGIHAGWVFFNKVDSFFIEAGKQKGLLFGQTDISYFAYTDSLITWIMTGLLIILLLIYGARTSHLSPIAKSGGG